MSKNSNQQLSRRAMLGGLAFAPVAALGAPSIILANEQSSSAHNAKISPYAEFSRRMIGDIEVIALADGFSNLPMSIIPALDQEAAENSAHEAYKTHNKDTMNIAINGFIIRTPTQTIAVDSGAPTFMAPTAGVWQESLKLAGVQPEEIDVLFLTHTHTDHVQGMTDQNAQRVMPNAQLVLSEDEWSYIHDDGILATLPEDFKPLAHFSRGQLAPYAQDRSVLSMVRETEIAPGVTAVPLPGHTPGHMGLRVVSGDQSLMIWGDLIHVPAYQFAHPDWGVVFDADMNIAHSTRERILDQMSAERTLVAGMHVDFPALGYVERTSDSFRYINAPRDYGY